jgi:hypothetical protein
MMPSSNPTLEDVVRMKDSIRTLYYELSSLIGGRLFPIPDGSPAAAELISRPDHYESLHTAYSQGISLIESAADHLMLFAKAIDVPAQTLAPWTCARSVLEASAVAVWLLDPAINVDLRIGRSFGRRIQGLIEQKKLAKCGAEAEFVEHAQTRIDSALDQVKLLRVIVERMPGSTEIIAKMLNEEELYRLLSAIAHGHHWALYKLGYTSAEKIEAESMNVAGKEFNPVAAVYAGQSAVRALSRAVWCVVRVYGFDLDSFGRIVDGFFDRMGTYPKGDLFWQRPK